MIRARGFFSSLFVAVAFLASTGCQTSTPVPLPPQWKHRPEALADFRQRLTIEDPASDRFVVSGLHRGDPGSGQRWTGRQTVLRFWPTHSKGLLLTVKFIVAESTLRDTGPIVVSVWVNQRLAARHRYRDTGAFEITATALSEWVSINQPMTVTLDVDPPWISPSDGTELGVLLDEVTIQ